MAFLTRRRFLQVSAGVATAGVLALGERAGVFAPDHPELVRLEIPLPRLPASFDGFTIAQLSDFHYDELTVVLLQRAIEIVNNLHPDLIVLTGDFVTVPILSGLFHTKKHAVVAAEPCAKLLAQLHARFGMVAVLGNHDAASDPRRISEILQSHGMPVLRNRSMPVEQGGARLWLSGVDDVMEGDPDIDLTLRGVPPNEAVVLLVHEPDFARRVAPYPVDLQLSGHSHGGQVWIPGIGAPWLPNLARKYPRGLYKVGPLTLYTNIGLGTIRIPVRVNCPPEITLFTLRAANGGVKTG